jgi:hypothetical protein
MTSLISTRNSTRTALLANSIFIGTAELVKDYVSASVSVNTQQDAVLSIFTSSDLQTIDEETFSITGGTLFTKVFTLTQPYFFLNLLNDTSTNNAYTVVETIYRSVFVSDPSATASTVNIQDTNGNALDSVSGSLKVIDNSRVTANVWTANSVAPAGTSAGINCSAIKTSVLTAFGSVSGACDLTLEYSADGTTFFSSQSVYTILGAGGFGFSLPFSAPFARLKRTDAGPSAVTITAVLCAS